MNYPVHPELEPYVPMWHEDDPRYTIWKRATIVILRRTETGARTVTLARVETKNGWSISTSQGLIHEWDKDWRWAFTPDDPLYSPYVPRSSP